MVKSRVPDWLIELTNDEQLVTDTPDGKYQKFLEQSRRQAVAAQRMKNTPPPIPELAAPPPPKPMPRVSLEGMDTPIVPRTDLPPTDMTDAPPAFTSAPPPEMPGGGPPPHLPMPEDSPENDHLSGNIIEEMRILQEITGLPPKVIATIMNLGETVSKQDQMEQNNPNIPQSIGQEAPVLGYNESQTMPQGTSGSVEAPPEIGPPPEIGGPPPIMGGVGRELP